MCPTRHRLQLMAIPLTKTQNLSDTQQDAPTKPWMAVGTSPCKGVGTTPWMEEVEPRLELWPRAMQEQFPGFFTNVCSVFDFTLLCSCIRDIRASMLKTQQETEKCSCLFCIHAIPGVKLKYGFILCISISYVSNKRPTAESRIMVSPHDCSIFQRAVSTSTFRNSPL